MDKLRRGGSDTGSATLGNREKLRLIQLAACLFLFLVIFMAKGSIHLERLKMELSCAINQDICAETAFSNMEWCWAEEGDILQTARAFWSEFFIPQKPETVNGIRGPMYRTISRPEFIKSPMLLISDQKTTSAFNPMEHSASREPASKSPAISESEVIHMEYTGPKLPDNATMDRYPLGLENTVIPVPGKVSSDFGWREHPIDHVLKFHRGVDLTAAVGTPVLAFAEGCVDYIGENESCGKYIQLRHNNGVTTFYCHCSRLCAQKGQSVSAGEKIAESGATGHVTGPHLHFELEKDGILLQPLYYIEQMKDTTIN